MQAYYVLLEGYAAQRRDVIKSGLSEIKKFAYLYMQKCTVPIYEPCHTIHCPILQLSYLKENVYLCSYSGNTIALSFSPNLHPDTKVN